MHMIQTLGTTANRDGIRPESSNTAAGKGRVKEPTAVQEGSASRVGYLPRRQWPLAFDAVPEWLADWPLTVAAD